jgi:hypothetical protein
MGVIWYRPGAVEKIGAVDKVEAGRWARITAGYVWLVGGRVLVLDGVLRLDGVVKVVGDV